MTLFIYNQKMEVYCRRFYFFDSMQEADDFRNSNYGIVRNTRDYFTLNDNNIF